MNYVGKERSFLPWNFTGYTRLAADTERSIVPTELIHSCQKDKMHTTVIRWRSDLAGGKTFPRPAAYYRQPAHRACEAGQLRLLRNHSLVAIFESESSHPRLHCSVKQLLALLVFLFG